MEDVSHDLPYWQGLAIKMAGKYEKPYKVIKDLYGAFNFCSVELKTTCEIVWTTTDPEPEPVLEYVAPESEQIEIAKPALDPNAKKILRYEAIVKRAQDRIAKLKGVE